MKHSTYKIGHVYKRDGKLIYITSGDYEIGGRISNAWTWKEVLNNGKLGPQKSGYGESNVEPVEFEIQIKIK